MTKEELKTVVGWYAEGQCEENYYNLDGRLWQPAGGVFSIREPFDHYRRRPEPPKLRPFCHGDALMRLDWLFKHKSYPDIYRKMVSCGPKGVVFCSQHEPFHVLFGELFELWECSPAINQPFGPCGVQ
jgi:hypothetical protein